MSGRVQLIRSETILSLTDAISASLSIVHTEIALPLSLNYPRVGSLEIIVKTDKLWMKRKKNRLLCLIFKKANAPRTTGERFGIGWVKPKR